MRRAFDAGAFPLVQMGSASEIQKYPWSAIIPRSRDNPELRWIDDTEIVCHLIAVRVPVLWHILAEEVEHRGAEFPEWA